MSVVIVSICHINQWPIPSSLFIIYIFHIIYSYTFLETRCLWRRLTTPLVRVTLHRRCWPGKYSKAVILFPKRRRKRITKRDRMRSGDSEPVVAVLDTDPTVAEAVKRWQSVSSRMILIWSPYWHQHARIQRIDVCLPCRQETKKLRDIRKNSMFKWVSLHHKNSNAKHYQTW